MDTVMLAALAEAHRLRIVELLRDRPCSVGEITQRLRISQPQVSKHLRVLSDAGIVEARSFAHWRVYQLRHKPFEELEMWLNTFRATWEDRLDSLEAYLHELQASEGRREERRKR